MADKEHTHDLGTSCRPESAQRDGKSKRSHLWKAALDGNLAQVEDCINCGMSVDSSEAALLRVTQTESRFKVTLHDVRDSPDSPELRQITPLLAASVNGHVQIVALLAHFGADVNYQTHMSEAPLDVAALNGHFEVVDILLKAGANVTKQDKTGRTALHLATMNCDSKIVKLLIGAGSDVNATDNLYHSSLFLACYRGYTEVLQILLDSGVVVNNVQGFCGLLASIKNGHTEVAKLLLTTNGSRRGCALNLNTVCQDWNAVMETVLSDSMQYVNCKDKAGCIALQFAVMAGRSGIVKLLLDGGADPDIKWREDDTPPLCHAVMNGQTEVVSMLISANADVNATDNARRTPLAFALTSHHTEYVGRLIEAGADVNILDADGLSSLVAACTLGHPDVALLLLKAGADVNVVYKGLTALWGAAINGYTELVQHLLAAGADINFRNPAGRTAVMIATDRGKIDVVKALVAANARMDFKDEDGRTALMYLVASGGPVSVVELFVGAGASVDDVDENGCSPLFIAAANGHSDVVKVLISAKSDINVKTEDGISPIWIAAQNGHLEIVKQLLLAGADVNSMENRRMTVVFAAAHFGFEKILKLLIEWKADVNACDINGASPLHVAAMNGHFESVKFLLSSGARIDCAGRKGRTPLFMAACHGHRSVAEVLIGAGSVVDHRDIYRNTSLIGASWNGHHDTVIALIESGADVNVVDKRGRCSLLVAAQNGHEGVVKVLLDAGAMVDVRDDLGRSALFAAAQNNRIRCAALLLNSGADNQVRDNEGRSVTMIAVKKGHLGIILPMLATGRDVNDKDYSGNSLLWVGTVNGHSEAIRLLLVCGVDTSGQEGELALYAASCHGYKDIVEALVGAGVNIDATDSDGHTALMAASFYNHDEIVKFLISAGADLRLKDRKKRTQIALSLKNAAIGGSKSVVRILLKVAEDSPRLLFIGDILDSLHGAIFNRKLEAVQILIRYCRRHRLFGISKFESYSSVSKYLTTVWDAAFRTGNIDVFRTLWLMFKKHPFDFQNICRSLSFNDVIDYGQFTSHGYLDQKRWLTDSPADLPLRTTLGCPSLSELISTPGLGNVLCLPENKALRVFEHTKKVVFEVVKDYSIASQEKVSTYNCGSAAEGTNVGLPDEMDVLVKFKLDRNSVEIVEHKHAYKYCNQKLDSILDYSDNQEVPRMEDYCSGSKSFHTTVFWKFITNIKQHEMTAKPIEMMPGSGHASTELWVKYPEQNGSFWVSVDLVPVLHFDNAWPSDAVQKTWLMDQQTLKSRGFALVSKPPHRNSALGQSVPEKERASLWRLSCSHLETEHMARLDQRIRNAYVAAKSVRHPDICRILLRDGDENIHTVDKYLTSYLLKTTFFHLVEDFIRNDRSLEEMTFMIYRDLEKYLEKGFLPLFWQRDANTFEGLSVNIKKSLRVAKLMKSFVGRLYIRDCYGEVIDDVDEEVVVYSRSRRPPVGYLVYADDPDNPRPQPDGADEIEAEYMDPGTIKAGVGLSRGENPVTNTLKLVGHALKKLLW